MDNRDQSASSEESAKLGLDDLDLPELSVESPTPEVDNSLKQSEIELEINNKQTTPVQEQSKSVSEEKLPAKTLTNQTKAASPNSVPIFIKKPLSPSPSATSFEIKIDNSGIKRSPKTELRNSSRRELDHSTTSDTSNKRREENDLVITTVKKSLFPHKPMVISQTYDSLVDQAQGANQNAMTEAYPSYKIDKRLIFLGKEVKYPKFVIPCQSTFRRFWNIFIMALIVYETFWYPLAFCFLYKDAWATGSLVFEIISVFIFAADIIINTRTTYNNKNNEEIVDTKMIRRRYLKSRMFIIDVLTTLPIPEIVLASLAGSDDQWLVFSILCLFRMFRLLKISTYLEDRNLTLRAKLIQFFIGCFLLEHFISCLWYRIVIWQFPDTLTTDELWFPPNMREAAANDDDLLAFYFNLPISQVYAATLLSIFMLTVGSDMGPVTRLQTWYCFLVAIFGAVGLGFLYAQVTQIIYAASEESLLYQEKLEELQKKLKVNRIPHNIRVKVMEYFYYSWKKRIVLKKMTEFSEVSIPLQRDITVFQNHQMVAGVPLFKELDPKEILSIIQKLKTAIYMPGDKILREGEKNTEMFFIQEGTVEILIRQATLQSVMHKQKRIKYEKILKEKGNYFGELALIANSRNSYNANAFEFCILYTFARSDYDGLKKEFTDIGPRLRTGLRHYKNSHMEEMIQIMKNLTLFHDFTDKELVRICDEYIEEVFVDPNQVILGPRNKTNALYIIIGGHVNCFANNEATRNYVAHLKRSDPRNNWTIVDADDKEEIGCLDDEILNLEKDRLSMEDDRKKLDLSKIYNYGEYFGTLDFEINEIKCDKYYLTDNGCQIGIMTEPLKEQMKEDDPIIYSKLQQNFIRVFPKRIMLPIEEESESSFSTTKNNTMIRNTLSRRVSLMSDYPKQPVLGKAFSLNRKEELTGVKGELQRLGDEMNLFQDLVTDIHSKLDRIIPAAYPNLKTLEMSPEKQKSKLNPTSQI